MIFKECGNSSNFFPGALAAISFEKFKGNMKDDWKKWYFKVVEIAAPLFQVHLEHYLTISSKFDVSATVGNLSLASWWRNKNTENKQGMVAWYIEQKKVWKCWSSKLQGKRRILHFIVDTSIATAAVSDFLELGSNLWNWKKCAKLEKVRKIGRNSNRMWTNLYHPCKILGNIVLFGSITLLPKNFFSFSCVMLLNFVFFSLKWVPL